MLWLIDLLPMLLLKNSMNLRQLEKIKRFAKPFYASTGRWHDWSHVEAVRRHALKLARRQKGVNLRVLEAACYLHDIGRSVKDKDHPEESVKIAIPFLRKIGLSFSEIEGVSHAIISHDVSKILEAKTVEARILFDADKLEILSVYGFIRVGFFLVEERGMEMSEAINFLWEFVVSVRDKYLQTMQAKETVNKDMKILQQVVERFNSWQQSPKR